MKKQIHGQMFDLGYQWEGETVELDAITLYVLFYVA
jgi:hypothetical protein